MKASENIDQLAAALAAAQGEFANPERNREVKVKTKAGGEYTFTYATFDHILEMARPVLAKHGLSVVQSPGTANEGVAVTTRVAHSSGQWIEDVLGAPYEGGPQGMGSVITYLRRYAFCSMLGITAEEDDDGNHGSGNVVTSSETKSRTAAYPPCPSCGKKDSVIKGSEEYGGGWVCWKKKDGCGHKWQDAEPTVTPLTAEQMASVVRILNSVKAANSVAALVELNKDVMALPEGDLLFKHVKPQFTARRKELDAGQG